MRRPRRIAAILSVFTLSTGFISADDKAIRVDVSDQKLTIFESGRAVKSYPVSTSRYGTGNRQGSLKTPLGRHRVKKKIGEGRPLHAVFENRAFTGRVKRPSRNPGGDVITSRILWLEGLEPGVNRGRLIDSFKRFIYIHGTAEEHLIGKPASNGCVRMKNRDIVELFSAVGVGTPVDIVE